MTTPPLKFLLLPLLLHHTSSIPTATTITSPACYNSRQYSSQCTHTPHQGDVCTLTCLDSTLYADNFQFVAPIKDALTVANATCGTSDVDITLNNVSFVELENNSFICGELLVKAAEGPAMKPDTVGKIIVPLFLLIGVIGNTMTIVVMCSKCFRHMAVSKLLIALSTSDTCFILLFPFNKLFVRELLGVDIRALSDASCKSFFWAFRTAKMTSSWFVVLIAIERFIAIWYSLHAVTMNTKKKAYISIATVVVVIGSYNGYWCSFADRIMPNGACIPNTQPPGLENQAKIFLVTGLTVYSFLPAVILVLLNGLIIIRIVGFRQRAVVTEKDRQRLDAIKTTIMLIAISVAFIVLVIPISCAHIYFFTQGKNIFEAKDPSFMMFREVAQILEQLNYSINFLLYVLCGSRFRERIFIMLGCKEERLRPSPPGSNVTNITIFKDYLYRKIGRKGSTSSDGNMRVASTWSLNVNQINRTHRNRSLDTCNDKISQAERVQSIHRAASKECFNAMHQINKSSPKLPSLKCIT